MFVSTILCLTIASLALFYSVLKLIKFYSFAQKFNKIPGRKGYPIVRNLFDFLGLPDIAFAELRKYISEFPEVCKSWLIFYPMVSIYEPEDIQKLIGTVASNKKSIVYDIIRPWLRDGLLMSSGAKWHARRKLLTPAFHFNILQKFLKIFNEESQNFVSNIDAVTDKEIDVVPVVNHFTLNAICNTAMGTNLNDMEGASVYCNSIHEFAKLVVYRITRPWLLLDFLYSFTRNYYQGKKIVKKLQNFSKTIIDERKKNLQKFWKDNNNDFDLCLENKNVALLDLLLLGQMKGEDIDDEGVREEVDTFMFEGHDTSAVSLCYTLMLLANNRDCQDKVYEEIVSVVGSDRDGDLTNNDLQELKYTEMCIKESLRLFPSVPMIARTAGEDIVTRKGYVIPKGVKVWVIIDYLHRRADLFPDPERFDPDRFLPDNAAERHPFAYIPFSAGPRNCIGQKFAMMEMKCLVAKLLRKYILEPIDTPDKVIFIMDFVLRPKFPIRVKFVPRT